MCAFSIWEFHLKGYVLFLTDSPRQPAIREGSSRALCNIKLICIFIGGQREIQALRVGVRPSPSSKGPATARKTIVIAAGSHAREWISTSTVNFVAYSFVTGYGRSREITRLLEKFDFVFIPTINPDGYFHSWEVDVSLLMFSVPSRRCEGIVISGVRALNSALVVSVDIMRSVLVEADV